jgi:hypothetical protein
MAWKKSPGADCSIRCGAAEQRFEPVPGRPMAQYVVVPGSLSNRDLASWLDAGLRYVTSLAPKQRRKARKRASR